MKLIFAISFVLLATWIYADPSMQAEDYDEVEAFTEKKPVQLDKAVNDDDDDEEADDEHVEDDADDFDGDNKKNCSRTLLKLRRCLKIDCRSPGLVEKCLRVVIFRCQADEDTIKCIYKLPACMSKFCTADNQKLRKPGRKCWRRFRKCVKKAEGSGMELE